MSDFDLTDPPSATTHTASIDDDEVDDDVERECGCDESGNPPRSLRIHTNIYGYSLAKMCQRGGGEVVTQVFLSTHSPRVTVQLELCCFAEHRWHSGTAVILHAAPAAAARLPAWPVPYHTATGMLENNLWLCKILAQVQYETRFCLRYCRCTRRNGPLCSHSRR
jgi:hypothetical protein